MSAELCEMLCAPSISRRRNTACCEGNMTLKKQLRRHLGKKTTKRLYNWLPWVGGAAALAAGVLVERRGVRGAVQDVRDLSSSVRERARGTLRDTSAPDRDLVGTH